MPMVEPMRIAIDAAISYHATALIQILVNIAIGEVNGIYEHTSIAVLSTEPLLIENITTINAIIKTKDLPSFLDRTGAWYNELYK